MNRFAFALCVALCSIGIATAADSAGYRKAYFGATKPGSFAQYVMKIEGQPDMGSTTTRLPDENGQQRVQVRIEYQSAGAQTVAFTNYVLKSGYSLENDALGYGKALVAMSASSPGTKPTVMPAAVIDSARKTMPDYAATAVFVGTENIGGKDSGHYRYVQRHPGTPEQIETGEIWLNETVPFGLVKQKAVTTEASGKVVSRFEMLLADSGDRCSGGERGGQRRIVEGNGTRSARRSVQERTRRARGVGAAGRRRRSAACPSAFATRPTPCCASPSRPARRTSRWAPRSARCSSWPRRQRRWRSRRVRRRSRCSCHKPARDAQSTARSP